MTLILETGAGVRDANSYVNPAFVTAYLSERGRSTENSWSTATTPNMEASCILGTQYISSRWGPYFKGHRCKHFDGIRAIASISMSANPSVDDTLTVGNQQYSFQNSITTFSVNSVLIGGSVAATLTNLAEAINKSGDGAAYSLLLQQNNNAEAEVDGSSLSLTALQTGLAGNFITLTESSSVITVDSTFVGGQDEGAQSLDFPRDGLTVEGRYVVGVPLPLRYAAAEYAVRALGAALLLDPTTDATGRVVMETYRKLGPIERKTRFSDNDTLATLIKPYPAADLLLAGYVQTGGRAIRA